MTATITIEITTPGGRIGCTVLTDQPPSLMRVAHELHRLLVALDAGGGMVPTEPTTVGEAAPAADWLGAGEPTAEELGARRRK